MKLDWLQKYSLFAFDEIDSTNSEALRMANSGAIGDFVILSKIQTGGRGTKGRQWESLEVICMQVFCCKQNLILKKFSTTIFSC